MRRRKKEKKKIRKGETAETWILEEKQKVGRKL